MTKRADDQLSRRGELCVLETARKPAPTKIMQEYDATALIGLKVIARHAAVECGKDSDGTIELPKLNELMAAAAVVRCLMPQRLRGAEIKAIRKIMRMTLADLAERMDGKTAVETISRWESEAQPMGGYAEKVLRLLVCETLHELAPGVEYDGSMISNLKQVDPWRGHTDYELPAIEIELMKVRLGGAVGEAWAA